MNETQCPQWQESSHAQPMGTDYHYSSHLRPCPDVSWRNSIFSLYLQSFVSIQKWVKQATDKNCGPVLFYLNILTIVLTTDQRGGNQSLKHKFKWFKIKTLFKESSSSGGRPTQGEEQKSISQSPLTSQFLLPPYSIRLCSKQTELMGKFAAMSSLPSSWPFSLIADIYTLLSSRH